MKTVSFPQQTSIEVRSSGEKPISNNGSMQIGPFNTAGTYHLYCTTHQNMNLTVQVQ